MCSLGVHMVRIGSALRDVCKYFAESGTDSSKIVMETLDSGPFSYCCSETPVTVHLITAFDSGGSSREIRHKFNLFAVGDIRNTLVSLSASTPDTHTICKLFKFRLQISESEYNPTKIFQSLNAILYVLQPQQESLEPPESVHIPVEQFIPLAVYLRSHPLSHEKSRIVIDWFALIMKELSGKPSFDYRNVSLGNLLITGAILYYNNDVMEALKMLHRVLKCQGIVIPSTMSHDATLATKICNDAGTIVVGQKEITGKETAPLQHSISSLFAVKMLFDESSHVYPVHVSASTLAIRYLHCSNLIIYPIGSFFTSVLANLLPVGISDAIRASNAIKIYIPNTFPDPEMRGIDLVDAVNFIANQGLSNKPNCNVSELLTIVLLDSRLHAHRKSEKANDLFWLEPRDSNSTSNCVRCIQCLDHLHGFSGLKVVRRTIVSDISANPCVDPPLLNAILRELSQTNIHSVDI